MGLLAQNACDASCKLCHLSVHHASVKFRVTVHEQNTTVFVWTSCLFNVLHKPLVVLYMQIHFVATFAQIMIGTSQLPLCTIVVSVVLALTVLLMPVLLMPVLLWIVRLPALLMPLVLLWIVRLADLLPLELMCIVWLPGLLMPLLSMLLYTIVVCLIVTACCTLRLRFLMD